MRQHVFVEERLNAPANKVWELVSTGTSIEKFLPDMITKSEVGEHGACMGGTRTCTLASGERFDEHIELKDDDKMIFQYSMPGVPGMPAKNFISTLIVKDAGEGSTLSWQASYEPEEGKAEEMEKMLTHVHTTAIQNIGKIVEGS